jgi:secondary thiamine-phosphate synthase enzyme
MNLHQQTVRIATQGGKALRPVTAEVQGVVAVSGVARGVCTVFIRHTSASLLLQESDAAPDIERFFARLVPEGEGYLLAGESPDDMPAHIRAALTQTSIQIPVVDGRLHLSHLQAVFLWEQRVAPQTRELHVTIMGVAHS